MVSYEVRLYHTLVSLAYSQICARKVEEGVGEVEEGLKKVEEVTEGKVKG